MSYIGKTPTAVPLTSSDITNGIITTAKIADDAISAAKLASGVGGKVLQLVHTEIATYPSRSDGTTYADIAGLNLSITPSSTSSKILIVFNAGVVAISGLSASFVLKRAISGGSTTILGGHTDSSRQAGWLKHTSISDGNHDNGTDAQYYDTSHNTTSAITYTVQWITQGTGYLNRNTSFENNNAPFSTVTNSRIYAMEIGA